MGIFYMADKKIETKEEDRLMKWDAEEEYFKGMCQKIECDLREVSKSVGLGILGLLRFQLREND
jgi:hypothetical protein